MQACQIYEFENRDLLLLASVFGLPDWSNNKRGRRMTLIVEALGLWSYLEKDMSTQGLSVAVSESHISGVPGKVEQCTLSSPIMPASNSFAIPTQSKAWTFSDSSLLRTCNKKLIIISP